VALTGNAEDVARARALWQTNWSKSRVLLFLKCTTPWGAHPSLLLRRVGFHTDCRTYLISFHNKRLRVHVKTSVRARLERLPGATEAGVPGTRGFRVLGWS
jgi:hypothetical protein